MSENPFNNVFKFFGDVKAPSFDFNAAFSAQRRNFEAFAQANQAVSEAVQAVTKRQVEAFQTFSENSLKLLRESVAGNPEANVARHAEFARENFESGLRNAREAFTIASKSNAEAAEAINRRLVELAEEVTNIVSSNGNISKKKAA